MIIHSEFELLTKAWPVIYTFILVIVMYCAVLSVTVPLFFYKSSFNIYEKTCPLLNDTVARPLSNYYHNDKNNKLKRSTKLSHFVM